MSTKFITILAALLIINVTPLSWALTVDINSGDRIFVPVKSFKTLRDENVIKQAYDYSCGAASLATLLTYGLGDDVSEKEILDQAMTTLTGEDVDLRKKEGLSLLDLQRVSLARGHKAMGFRLTPEYLSKLETPVMVYIEPRGYEHFAVLKGIRGSEAFLADPSLGNVRMPLYRFLHMWQGNNEKGIIFVVERADSRWPGNYPLKLQSGFMAAPAMVSVRQMMEHSSLMPDIIQPLLLPR